MFLARTSLTDPLLNIRSISLIVVVKCRAEEEDKVVQTTRWSAQPSDLPLHISHGWLGHCHGYRAYLSLYTHKLRFLFSPRSIYWSGEECGSFEVADIFCSKNVALV